MNELLRAGQRFRFATAQECIWLESPFGGGLAYQVPASNARIYRKELLSDPITIPETETFWVETAFWSAVGYFIIMARRLADGARFSFVQAKRDEHDHLLPTQEDTPAVILVDANITEYIVIAGMSYRHLR